MDLTAEFLARIARESGNAKIVADAAFRVVWVNRAFEETTGYALADVVGKRPGEFLQGPDTDRGAVDAIRAQLRCGGPVDTELLNYRRSGEPFWVSLRIRPLRDEAGSVVGYHSTQQDITARREAERRLAESLARAQHVLDTVEAVLVWLDVEGRITMLNRAGAALLGVTESEVLGTSWFERFQPVLSDGRPDGDRYADIMADRAPEAVVSETTLRTASGEVRQFRWHTAYLRDGDGHRAGALKSGNDVTERRALQLQANRRARLEAIGTMAGGIAHDLNNALTPITMGLEAIAESAPDAAHLVSMMDASAKRASSLVRQLLNFAKGAEGEQQPIALVEVVREVESLVRRTFPKAVRIDITTDELLPVVVGDPTQLHQVLLNLCVNARDAMPHGGHLRIAAERVTLADDERVPGVVMGQPGAGTHVRLAVHDDGAGIAPHTMDRIFEPFFSTKGPEGGTGLGLSNVLGIVRGHGGFVQVQSTFGRGSCFAVWLPAAAGDLPVVPLASASPFAGLGRRVLYVDDEAPIRVLATLLLRRLGCEAVTADSVEAAMRTLTRTGTRIDVVVTDLHMPGEDGLALVRRVRGVAPQIPLVVATGLANDGQREALGRLGRVHVLDKPYDESQLADALRVAFAWAEGLEADATAHASRRASD